MKYGLSIVAMAALCLSGCVHRAAAPDTVTPKAESTDSPASSISFGNGEKNWIVTDGLTREGATFTFREARIDGNGWLVLHPFKDGKPVGEIYSGASYLRDGTNRDVEVSVDEPPNPGTMFLVMLHLDVNENREFDFVFVDERNVLDRAVFEGMRMIAHTFASP